MGCQLRGRRIQGGISGFVFISLNFVYYYVGPCFWANRENSVTREKVIFCQKIRDIFECGTLRKAGRNGIHRSRKGLALDGSCPHQGCCARPTRWGLSPEGLRGTDTAPPAFVPLPLSTWGCILVSSHTDLGWEAAAGLQGWGLLTLCGLLEPKARGGKCPQW